MTGFKNIKNFLLTPLLYLFIAFILFACSNENDSKKNPINIKSINAVRTENRTPKENDFQVDVALTGVMSDNNINQDIQYDWFIEYEAPDIKKEYSLGNNNTKEELTVPANANKNYLNGYYFLDISKDPLNAMLTVYKPGYYKVTLQASNIDEVKEHSIILKIGEPELPELFVKVNVPISITKKEDNFKGKFFITSSNDNIASNVIKQLDALDLKNDWFNTKILLNPFKMINIKAGTHLDEKTKRILSIGKNNKDIVYYFYENDTNIISSSPLIFKNVEDKSLIFISKGEDDWMDSEILISFLQWGTDKNNKDRFNYFERSLNNKENVISANISNFYMTKIFIGSFGIKCLANKYFVFFGPEGIDIEELDPKNEREFTTLPYGYLVGKLGVNGSPFPIGNEFVYNYSTNYQVYKLDAGNNFIKE